MKPLTAWFGSIIFWVCFLPALGQDLVRTDSLELALQLADSPKEEADIHLALAEELQSNQPKSAEDHALKALRISDSVAYLKGQIVSKRLLADIYQKSSLYKKALRYATEAAEQANQQGDPEELAKLKIVLGLIFSDLGDYEKSSRYMFESLELYEQVGSKKGISKALNSVGYIYFEQEQYDKALEYYAQSLSIAREINDDDGISRGLNNIAAVYGVKGNFERVKHYLFEAVQINRKIGQRYWEGINYMNLGALSMDECVYDSAYFYFTKAIRIFEELDDVLQRSKSLLGLSGYYLARDSISSSLKAAREALALGTSHRLVTVKAEAAQMLREIFNKTGNIDSAYYYSIYHEQLKDSLQLEKSITRISQLELLYEFEKLTQENQMREQKREFLYILIILSLSFVMIVGFLVYSHRQKIRAKNLEMARSRLQLELDEKNRELTYNVMALMKKNEVLSEIAGKLMDVESEAVRDETKSAIRKIARDLQKTGDDEVWREFEVRFKQVHGDFYDKLLQSYPDLTPNEQKLCAFLRLNLSTKEISELTGQRPSTLEIARSRLRKKLGISNKQVNLVTFLSRF